jgi:hypothetical protein
LNDPFLEETGVKTEEDAIREALKSALQQRQNKVYTRDEVGNERREFRNMLAKLIREESKRYTQPLQPVSGEEHFQAIRRISDALSGRFRTILKDGRLRYGTSQKALNLYLKFLWRLGKAGTPPHCPIDGTVLEAAGVIGSWTRSDSEEEYVRWINEIRRKASPRTIAEWEYQAWQSRKRGASAEPDGEK